MSFKLCTGMYFICLLELRNDTNAVNPSVSIYIYIYIFGQLRLILPLLSWPRRPPASNAPQQQQDRSLAVQSPVSTGKIYPSCPNILVKRTKKLVAKVPVGSRQSLSGPPVPCLLGAAMSSPPPACADPPDTPLRGSILPRGKHYNCFLKQQSLSSHSFFPLPPFSCFLFPFKIINHYFSLRKPNPSVFQAPEHTL